MGIEIRQLVVKSNVVERDGEKAAGKSVNKPGGCEHDAIRKNVLEECKEWLLDLHAEAEER